MSSEHDFMLHNRAGWETPTRWGRRHPGGGVGDPHGLGDPRRLGDALGRGRRCPQGGVEDPRRLGDAHRLGDGHMAG